MNPPPISTIAIQFGCTPAQVRAQFAKNAAQLEGMAEKAKATGKKVNGSSETELRTMAAKALARSRE